ncbi:hypothetical protein Mycch_3266 [Mycolicibacterium chubuense NBB4]|uniref:Uncharacterized protein MT0599 domain-containing protein n=1 Tax=Mycolicibacterium chubuense (strain NBB4) TaxID=710421 RepID=I4BL55_MYCCN|nr:hypothetical protein [Mycolicibacterium chubuense]AFM18012.1 hypothetical protein Mycch_3266 [Mycolicibacterium chubuense NBB4]
MAEYAAGRQKPREVTAVTRFPKETAAKDEKRRGARIVVLTEDPRRSVVIVPGCHIDSMQHCDNAYFFEDGDELVGMIVEGGTVEYHPDERTYVVQLTDGRHTPE